LIPIITEGDMNFRNKKYEVSPDEMAKIAKEISSKL
jgi:hypothetical protein